MMLPVEELYELTFYLIYRLKIQPSEVNELTIPESRHFVRLYHEVKTREAETYKNLKEGNKVAPKKIPVKYVRHRR